MTIPIVDIRDICPDVCNGCTHPDEGCDDCDLASCVDCPNLEECN
jgi:hypothetical protein